MNIRTFWTLSHHMDHGDPITGNSQTLELQIKHRYPEDDFKFVIWDEGDELLAMTKDEFDEQVKSFEEHEPEGDLELYKDALRARTVILKPGDARWRVFERLVQHWNALCLVVDPDSNIF